MTKINFEGMTGPALVAMYNNLVEQCEALGITWNTKTKRFADRASAEKRINKLTAEVETKKAEMTAQVPTTSQNTLQAAPMFNSGPGGPVRGGDNDTPAADAPAEETAPATAGAEDNQVQEEQPPADESEEDMAKRKKAAAKKGGKKGVARSTSGTTIREMTDEFNAIVAKMNKGQKDAAPWARHHSSNFESKDAAKKQLDRLKKAIK
jgi:hypothetical protein